jgi:DNA polymerase-3 subunit beta
MKLTTCQTDLDHALRTIAPAIATKPTHPILDCVLIKAAKGTMTLTGFNLDLGISVTCPAVVDAAGSIALPYRLLARLVGRIDADQAVSLSNGCLTADGGSYTLALQDPADYPAFPEVKTTATSVAFTNPFKHCIAIAANDASKMILSGIHLADGLMEATDGHRLMRMPIDLPEGFDVVVPAPTMKMLQDRMVSIAAKSGHAIIDAGDGITIYSRILDGTYPDVGKLIPKSYKHEITLDRHKFVRCLERVAIIAEAHNSIVKLTASHGVLVITAEADANNAKEMLPYTGTADQSWSVNVSYLLDGLKAFRDQESIYFWANDPVSPIVIESDGENAPLYLVMPVQTR